VEEHIPVGGCENSEEKYHFSISGLRRPEGGEEDSSSEHPVRESLKGFQKTSFHFGVRRFESPEDLVKVHFGG
jgi:hypothetical protein